MARRLQLVQVGPHILRDILGHSLPVANAIGFCHLDVQPEAVAIKVQQNSGNVQSILTKSLGLAGRIGYTCEPIILYIPASSPTSTANTHVHNSAKCGAPCHNCTFPANNPCRQDELRPPDQGANRALPGRHECEVQLRIFGFGEENGKCKCLETRLLCHNRLSTIEFARFGSIRTSSIDESEMR